MSNVVKCPICSLKRVTKSRRRFFRCCGVLHSVKDNLLGSGIKRYEITGKVKVVGIPQDVEVEFI